MRFPTFRPLATLGVLAALTTPSHAESTVVLPFEEEARDDRGLAGFGLGLAAIVEADLVDLPGLDLDAPSDHVARARRTADAGLTRRDGVAVGDAARLARDLELDWAFTGTWSVEQRTLTVTYRLVDTDEQRIAEAEQSGPASDFQTVHKSALLALLAGAGLDLSPGIQRRIQGRVLTEDAEAVAAWGRSQKALAEDDPKAAVKHLEQALSSDPGFTLGSEALADARIAAERARLETSIDATATRTEALIDALEKTQEELTLSKRTKKLSEQSELLLRFTLLNELARPCEAETEMHHFLIRNQGRFARADKKTVASSLEARANQLKIGRQLKGINEKIGGEEEDLDGESVRSAREPRPIHTVAPRPPLDDLLIGSNRRLGLLAVGIGCAGESADARLDAIDRVRATVERIQTRKIQLKEPTRLHLALRTLFEQARRDGWTDAVMAEHDRISALELGVDAGRKRDTLLTRIERAAAQRDEVTSAMSPWTPDSWTKAVAAGPDLLQNEGSCASLDDNGVLGPTHWPRARETADRVMEDGWVHRSERDHVVRALTGLRLAWLMGCLVPQDEGLPAPDVDVSTAESVLRWYDALEETVNRLCTTSQAQDLRRAAEALRDGGAGKNADKLRLTLLKRAAATPCLASADLAD